MPAPLFIKYRTKHGNCYVYDCATGRILAVDEVVYEIIDDFRILTDEEIHRKHNLLGSGKVQAALDDLYEIRKKHHLTDHDPKELSPIEIVEYEKRQYPLGEFWKSAGALLILGLTERCNLNCEYCCYSGKFEGQRVHSDKVMDMAVARQAIRQFLEGEQVIDGIYPISFYGGEPLLTFYHLEECVRFAVEEAGCLGKKLRFAVTTNGTLLSDEVCDFLVEHDFLTIISLDGPRQMHDRYRVFPDGRGSFDLVWKNLRRFVERYPDYKNRGLNITLSPPFDLEETGLFVEECFQYFPLIRASVVNIGSEYRFGNNETTATRYGCSSCSHCENGLHPKEDFRQFRDEDKRQLKKLWDDCLECIARDGVAGAWRRMPFAMALFDSQISHVHGRNVTRQASEWEFMIPCLPGFTRRFCDVDGHYRVCERVDDSAAYRLGNVWDGLDSVQMERVLELRRHFGDCGNCSALKSCDICFARIPCSDKGHEGYDPNFDRQCREARRSHEKMLQLYTEIMEVNPAAFERHATDSGNSTLRFGAPNSRIDEETMDRLKLESFHSF